MKIRAMGVCAVVLTSLPFAAGYAVAEPEDGDSSVGSKTVIGPRNPFLVDGAAALDSGDAERGIELTRKGLAIAQGAREHKVAWSNLCAGYLLNGEPHKALDACNRVIAEDPKFWRAYNNRALVYLELGEYERSEADIRRGQALRPDSKRLRLTRARLLDATDPVTPTVEIDERRSVGDDETGQDDTPF